MPIEFDLLLLVSFSEQAIYKPEERDKGIEFLPQTQTQIIPLSLQPDGMHL